MKDSRQPEEKRQWNEDPTKVQLGNDWVSHIAAQFIQRRSGWFVFAFCVGLVSLVVGRDFHLDRRLESMFPSNSTILNDYQLLKQSFGGNEVILMVFKDDDFWSGSKESMLRLSTLSDNVAKVPGVRAVMDLSQVDKLVRSVESDWSNLFTSLSKNSSKQDGIRGDTPLAIAMRKQFSGYTHSPNSSWLAIAAMLNSDSQSTLPERSRATATHSETIRELRRVASSHFHQATHQPTERSTAYFLVGEPVLVEEGFDLIEQDGVRLGWTSSMALALFLIFVLRTVRWMIATLLVVHWSLWVTRAICVASGWQLTMVSSMLVAMVTVIGIATTMHWFIAHRRLISEGVTYESAMKLSLQDLITPIFWACTTTALGFGALLAARVEPIRDYGVMMSVASMVVLLGIFLIVPWIVLFEIPSGRAHSFRSRGRKQEAFQAACSVPLPNSRLDGWIGEGLRWFLELILKWPQGTWAFLLGWLVCVVIGAGRVEVETDFLKNFRSDSSLVQGYRIVEEELGGAGVWDVIVPAPPVIGERYLEEVGKLEKKLSSLSDLGLTKVISLAGAEAAARRSPILEQLPLAARLAGMRTTIPVFYDSLLTPSPSNRLLRIMLRAKESVGASAKHRLIQSVTKIVQEHTQSDEWLAAMGNSEHD